MKIRKTISLALVMTLLASFACWLGYQHSSTPAGGGLRIATSRSLKQVGLGHRGDHNDISHFNATGAIVAPKPEAEDR